MDQWVVWYSLLNINLTFVCETLHHAVFDQRERKKPNDKNTSMPVLLWVLFVVNFSWFVGNLSYVFACSSECYLPFAITFRRFSLVALSVANIDFGSVYLYIKHTQIFAASSCFFFSWSLVRLFYTFFAYSSADSVQKLNCFLWRAHCSQNRGINFLTENRT